MTVKELNIADRNIWKLLESVAFQLPTSTVLFDDEGSMKNPVKSQLIKDLS